MEKPVPVARGGRRVKVADLVGVGDGIKRVEMRARQPVQHESAEEQQAGRQAEFRLQGARSARRRERRLRRKMLVLRGSPCALSERLYNAWTMMEAG